MASTITHTGVGNVSNTSGLGYSFSFATLHREDIQVEVIDPSGNRGSKTVTTDYTIENYSEAGSSNSYIKFVSETTRGFTNSQTTYKVRIFRSTSSIPKTTFVAGSSITASDLNKQTKQALHLSEENRDSLSSLALGDGSASVSINSSNIVDLSIQAIDIKSNAVETEKIKDLAVTTNKINDLDVTTGKIDNLAVTTGKIDNLAVTTGKIANLNVTTAKLANSTGSSDGVTTAKIADGAVTNAKITDVAGSKVTPNFGSQNIVTTGTLGTGNITIANSAPTINFTDDNNDSDFRIRINDGAFKIQDTSNNNANRFVVNTDGHVDFTNNVDIIGTCTATTFSGSGASLTNLPTIGQQFQEATSDSEETTTTSASPGEEKVSLQLTNCATTSRILIYYTFESKFSGNSNGQGEVKISGGTFATGDLVHVINNSSFVQTSGVLLDVSSATTRTYKIYWRKTNSQAMYAFIKNAKLYAIEFKP